MDPSKDRSNVISTIAECQPPILSQSESSLFLSSDEADFIAHFVNADDQIEDSFSSALSIIHSPSSSESDIENLMEHPQIRILNDDDLMRRSVALVTSDNCEFIGYLSLIHI